MGCATSSHLVGQGLGWGERGTVLSKERCSHLGSSVLHSVVTVGLGQGPGQREGWVSKLALAALLDRENMVAVTSRTAGAREKPVSSPVSRTNLCIFHFHISLSLEIFKTHLDEVLCSLL